MTELMNSPLYQVIWRTRRLFQRLRATGDELHPDSGITTSQRAVLEFLSRHQPQTVPQMAREKSVTRQHIQVIVDKLLGQGLVESIPNPAHSRSSLIRITPSGSQLFEAIQQRELKLLALMERQFTKKQLLTTARTLQAVEEHLQSQPWRDLLPPTTKGDTT